MRRLVLVALALCIALPLSADFRTRRERLAGKLEDRVLLLFASTEEEGQNAMGVFRQNNDFYYLTGWNEPGAALLLAAAKDDRPYTEILFLPGRNVTQERWTGPKLAATDAGAAKITGFDRVEPLDRLRDELVSIVPSPRGTVLTDRTIGEIPIAWLRRANAFPNYVRLADARPVIAELRLIKDAQEIALIRKATDATVAAHRAGLRAIRPGVTENEMAGLIEYEFRRGGCQTPAFSSIVGSGANSTVLHYSANSGTIQAGDVVVIDIGAECSHYASDVTRTLPASGRFTPRQREIYQIVLDAQQAAVSAFQAGVSTIGRDAPDTLYKVAYDVIEKHGLGRYFIHGLSHYVGLHVHDAGDGARPLQAGAVFTIEPGIYIPEEKIGVRIEDTYLVREDGSLECLSCGAPKTVAEIERAITSRTPAALPTRSRRR